MKVKFWVDDESIFFFFVCVWYVTTTTPIQCTPKDSNFVLVPCGFTNMMKYVHGTDFFDVELSIF